MVVADAYAPALALPLAVCLCVAVAVLLRRRRAASGRGRQLVPDAFADRFARWRAARRQRRAIDRLDRSLCPAGSLLGAAELDEFDRAGRPAIEKVAADLRRLGAQRRGVAARSQVWHSAVMRAYDDHLRLASRCLGVAEHLDRLDGIDLAIERVRVEGELQAAGLHLSPPSRQING